MLTIGLDKPGCASTCAPPGGGRDQASQMNVDEPGQSESCYGSEGWAFESLQRATVSPGHELAPSAAGSSSTASGRILATGELRPLYDTATEPGGGVVERAQ